MRIIRTLLSFFGISRPSRPEDIPKKLDAATLALAMEEARKLRAHHQVEVQSLAAGEIPIPRRADD
jgi:hypothetical protein